MRPTPLPPSAPVYDRDGTLLSLGSVLVALAVLIAAVLLLPGMCGCGTLSDGRAVSASADDCRYYDDSFLAWQAVGAASSGLAAAAGSGGIIAQAVPDAPNEDWTVGLAVTSAVLGVLGTVGVLLAGEYADRYAERCMNGAEAPSEGGP